MLYKIEFFIMLLLKSNKEVFFSMNILTSSHFQATTSILLGATAAKMCQITDISPNRKTIIVSAIAISALTGVAAAYKGIKKRTAAMSCFVVSALVYFASQTSWAKKPELDLKIVFVMNKIANLFGWGEIAQPKSASPNQDISGIDGIKDGV